MGKTVPLVLSTTAGTVFSHTDLRPVPPQKSSSIFGNLRKSSESVRKKFEDVRQAFGTILENFRKSSASGRKSSESRQKHRY